ncbi:peroxiredoxin family protein [Desulfuromonas sp. AOP6]|uniref:peroxiredoxin family protein n=1 Tax=Desulfuromonas sp. AOP6 TaxID=1566351 RepID=UPI00127E1F58|nr:peroxiredoxin family protein [Desulfuromonas sp. AOP6]BCA81117.1 hypothetical protein AOP6_2904 [Desulfuromonas sp. AOP6]
MKRHWFAAIPLLFLLLFAPALAAALEVGAAAPDFKLKNLDGKEVRLSDYKGQFIILKLATTWCPTCKQQMQEFNDVRDFLKENNVQIVDVYVQDSPDMVKKHAGTLAEKISYMPLIDDGSALKAYNVYLIPRVLIIDPDMKVQRDGSLITAYDLRLKIRDVMKAREKAQKAAETKG